MGFARAALVKRLQSKLAQFCHYVQNNFLICFIRFTWNFKVHTIRTHCHQGKV